MESGFGGGCSLALGSGDNKLHLLVDIVRRLNGPLGAFVTHIYTRLFPPPLPPIYLALSSPPACDGIVMDDLI